MKRILLFTQPLPEVITKITPLLFPLEMKLKRLAYLPADGRSIENKKYITFWEKLAQNNNAKFSFIDNSKVDTKSEIQKIHESNIILITGGSTFVLLRNLKRSGLDKAIKDFVNKENFVLGAFSAGAVVLTPTIKIVQDNWHFGPDTNEIGLQDLTGLRILNFEVLPHFNKKYDQKLLKKYSDQSKYPIKTIEKNNFINIEL